MNSKIYPSFWWGLVWVLHCWGSSVFAIDPTAYLVSQDFQYQLASPKNSKIESYRATNSLGLGQNVEIWAAQELHSIVVSSLFAEATIGRENRFYAPVLLERGNHGVLELEQVKRQLKPGSKPFVGPLLPAVMYSARKTTRINRDELAGVGASELTHLLKTLCVPLLLGNRVSRITRDGGLAELRFLSRSRRVVLLPQTRLFGNYSFKDPIPDLIKHYFRVVPKKRLVELSTADYVLLLDSLNEFLTRIEGMSEESLRILFKPYVHNLKTRPGTDEDWWIEELLHRISGLRKGIRDYLVNHSGTNGSLVDAHLTASSTVSAPLIRLPKFGNKLKFLEPRELLWRLFFSKASARHALFEKTTTSETLDQLRARSNEDTKIFEVSSSIPYGPYLALPSNGLIYSEKSGVQSHTMVVLHENDFEAHVISRTASRLGMEVFTLNQGPTTFGRRLSERMVSAILARANRQKINRLIIVEVPGDEQLENSLKVGRIQSVHFIDHHDHLYPELNFRQNYYSSFEQFSQLVGYKPTPEEVLVGARDKCGVFGMLKLGLSVERTIELMETKTWFPGIRGALDVAESWKPVREDSEHGPLYVFNKIAGVKIADIVSALAIVHQGRRFQVLVYGKNGNQDYFGSAEVVTKLLMPISETYGFDGSRSRGWGFGNQRFWGFYGPRTNDRINLQKDVRKALKLAIEPSNKVISDCPENLYRYGKVS